MLDILILRQKYNQYYIIDKFECSKAFQRNHKLAETSDITFMNNRHATYRYYREKTILLKYLKI